VAPYVQQLTDPTFSFLFKVNFIFQQDIKKRAINLVRLALFQEQKRVPLRRDEISKKVMGSQRGTFKAVFEEAQSILRSTFGMELVELPTRAATHDMTAGGSSMTNKETADTQNAKEGGDRQAVTGLKKKGVYRVIDVVRPLGLRRYAWFGLTVCVLGFSSHFSRIENVHPPLSLGSDAHRTRCIDEQAHP
jgi:MAGE family